MEKKTYSKPVLSAQRFEPQEFVASCEHSESGAGNYLFDCDAGISGGYAHGMIYRESYGSPDTFNYTTTLWGGVNVRETEINGFHACHQKHESPTTDEYTLGWFVPCEWNGVYHYGYQYDRAFKVIIWQGDGDLHCTENLNRETWEKNVS